MIDKLGLTHKLEHATKELDEITNELYDVYSENDTIANEQTQHLVSLWESMQDDLASIRAYIVGA